MQKRIIFYILLSFLVVSFTLVLTEAILRASGRIAVHGLHTASKQSFNQIPGIFEPGEDFISRKNPKLPFHITINLLGYRGPGIEREKRLGTVRILCLGDSTTFGDFVNDDETFPHQLQKLFVQQQEKVEFINGGVGGSTIVDQMYFLKKSMEIDPDVVILTFYLNDIPGLDRAIPLYKSFEKNRKFKSSFVFGTIYKLFGDTALFQLVLKIKAKYYVQFERDNNLDSNALKKETELLQRYAEHFRDMNSYLQESLVKFMFVVMPSHHQVGQRTSVSSLLDSRVEEVVKFAHGLGVPVVNLQKLFKESNLSKNELYLLPYDGHPSKTAYTMAANSMFESLNKEFPNLF